MYHSLIIIFEVILHFITNPTIKICGVLSLTLMVSCAVPQSSPPEAESVLSQADTVSERSGYLVTYAKQDNKIRRQARLTGYLTLDGSCVAVRSGSVTQILALPESSAKWADDALELITSDNSFGLGQEVSFGGFHTEKSAIDIYIPDSCDSEKIFIGYLE